VAAEREYTDAELTVLELVLTDGYGSRELAHALSSYVAQCAVIDLQSKGVVAIDFVVEAAAAAREAANWRRLADVAVNSWYDVNANPQHRASVTSGLFRAG